MIELTEHQAAQLPENDDAAVAVVNPRTCEKYVLVPVDVYERLTDGDYDDSTWTREEVEALNWENLERREKEEGMAYDDWDEK